MKIEELNEQIKKHEEEIVDRRVNVVNMKENVEMLKAVKLGELETIYTETKDKAFSNASKREMIINKDESIVKVVNELESFNISTKMLDIDVEYLKRLFRIEEMQGGSTSSLTRIADALEAANKLVK